MPKFPESRIRKVQDGATDKIEFAFDRNNRFRDRVKAFIKGENELGRGVGMIADIWMVFLPSGIQSGREAAQKIIEKQTKRAMPKRVKPYLKQKSTWEGIAAVLGAVGVTIYPEAIIEIVTGVFAVIGGIELWRKESEDE